MKKLLLSTALTVGLLAVGGLAQADTITSSGVLDAPDPTWDNPSTGSDLITFYDVFSFSVDTAGTYSFLSFYPGDTGTSENMDGTLNLFASPFDAAAPGAVLGFDDDYTAGDVGALAPFDAACGGSNCSGFDAALTAGTSYTLVQSSFSDVPTSFGQPTGPYDLTLTGPGTISPSVVPIPAAAWLFGSALLGLAAVRRKRLKS